MKKVIIILGPPGSGKDTQAFKLNRELGLNIFQTSAILKKRIGQMDQNDPERIEAERMYKAGELMPTLFVAKLVLGEIEDMLAGNSDLGLVFAGSPRTVHEAELFVPFMESHYGKENIHVFFLKVAKEESIHRNMGRKICEANGHPLPDMEQYHDIMTCRYDGSQFIKRDLDVSPEFIGHRYDVYIRDTEPVLDVFRKHGYEVTEIIGQESITKVHEEILHHISQHPIQ